MATIIIEPGEAFEHTHSKQSTTILREGSVELEIDGDRRPLQKDVPVQIRAGQHHVMRNTGSTPAAIHCVH